MSEYGNKTHCYLILPTDIETYHPDWVDDDISAANGDAEAEFGFASAINMASLKITKEQTSLFPRAMRLLHIKPKNGLSANKNACSAARSSAAKLVTCVAEKNNDPVMHKKVPVKKKSEYTVSQSLKICIAILILKQTPNSLQVRNYCFSDQSRSTLL